MYDLFVDLMKMKGVKTADVCKATGLRQSMMSDWKSGRYTPKADKLQRIADYFGVSIEYFTGGADTEQKPAYYLDTETAHAAQEVFSDPETRLLFDAARGARPEDIRLAAEMLKRMKETNPDG